MATPDPPPNSLGLDLAHPEPASDSQPKGAPEPSPPEPTAQSPTDTASPATPDAAATTSSVPNANDATKSNAPKKAPYINPERVKTGGLPRVNLVLL
jgi:hypothetical protein